MIPIGLKISVFFKSVWHGFLGIVAELGLIACIMLAGLVTCLLWWGIFR